MTNARSTVIFSVPLVSSVSPNAAPMVAPGDAARSVSVVRESFLGAAFVSSTLIWTGCALFPISIAAHDARRTRVIDEERRRKGANLCFFLFISQRLDG